MRWMPTEDDLDRALLLVARGGSWEDVGKHFGVSKWTVGKRLSGRADYQEALEARAVVARTHGRLSTYRAGCRCAPCREAQADRQRKLQDRKRPPKHGTVSAYRNHGCRCEPCRNAGAAANSAGRERLRNGDWTAGHGTRVRYGAGCRCRECTAAYAKGLREASRRNSESLDGATRHGWLWTGPEMELLVTRPDLTTRDLATMLGRTIEAVTTKRQRVRDHPKWAKAAGASRDAT